ncbi:MAG: hypothetical protein PHE15_01635, partial [Dehalococcoidales bacterium]|nr:hypothetical protein [Dehalococcoidales bacterium]
GGITSMQFDPVITGMPTVKCAAVFGGEVFILTYAGLTRFTGGAIEDLSTQLNAEWNDISRVAHVWTLGYQPVLKWLYVSNITEGTVYVFDIPQRRWICKETTRANYRYATGNPSGKLIFTDGTNQPKYINPNNYRAIAGTIWFPFTSIGNPTSDKYLRRIFLNYKNTIRIRAYGRMNVGDTPITLLDKTISNTSRTGTGTISSSGTSVTGAGTLFTTELCPNDTIVSNSQTKTVVSVTDNTHMVVDSAFTSSLSGKTFTYTKAEDDEAVICTSNERWREISIRLDSTATGAMVSDVSIEFEERIK